MNPGLSFPLLGVAGTDACRARARKYEASALSVFDHQFPHRVLGIIFHARFHTVKNTQRYTHYEANKAAHEIMATRKTSARTPLKAVSASIAAASMRLRCRPDLWPCLALVSVTALCHFGSLPDGPSTPPPRHFPCRTRVLRPQQQERDAQ